MKVVQPADTFYRCVIDYPIDLAPDELISSSRAVNTLLKNPYLLATTGDTHDAFNLLFDLASDLVQYDVCAFVSDDQDGDRFELTVSRGISSRRLGDPMLRHAVDISRFFGKAVILSPETDPRTDATCSAWGARFLTVFPLRKNREFMGALVFGRSDAPVFSREQVKLLWFLALQAENHLLQAESIKALSFYSFLDPLTHLYNRRYFDNQIEREVVRSQRTGKPLSLLMIDLDGFKSYNDRFHHAQGDIVLQEFAAIPLETVRDVDTVSRFGGDEFAVILVESDAEHGTEKRFSLGWFDERYLRPSPVMTVFTPAGGIRAFANLITEYQRNELTVDLMRYRSDVESGTMDFLFIELFRWARERGYGTFNLGLSALARVGKHPDSPAVERALNFIFEHVNHFYSFKGVHDFKEKFGPRWEPRYLVHPGARSLPAVALALILADSGTSVFWPSRQARTGSPAGRERAFEEEPEDATSPA